MPKKLPAIPSLKDLNFRKTLSVPALLKGVRSSFNKIKDFRKNRPDYSLPDILMSGLAVFSLKYPSLLQFDNDQDTPRLKHNLRTPVVDIIQNLQRQGVLESFRYLGGYLVSSDGTGHYSSHQISCPDCCEKHHRNGKVEYYHQLLGTAIVNPDMKTVALP